MVQIKQNVSQKKGYGLNMLFFFFFIDVICCTPKMFYLFHGSHPHRERKPSSAVGKPKTIHRPFQVQLGESQDTYVWWNAMKHPLLKHQDFFFFPESFQAWKMHLKLSLSNHTVTRNIPKDSWHLPKMPYFIKCIHNQTSWVQNFMNYYLFDLHFKLYWRKFQIYIYAIGLH